MGKRKKRIDEIPSKELKVSFNTFFFEAWKFEKDDNLPVSLLEFLLHKSNTVTEEFYDDILKYGGKILIGFGNSIKFNVPLYPKGPSIRVDPSKFVDEFTFEETLVSCFLMRLQPIQSCVHFNI